MRAQALMMPFPNPMIACDAADFDGTNDVMHKATGLTGAADSKSGILSVWFRVDGAGLLGANPRLITMGSSGGVRFFIQHDSVISSTNKFLLQGQNAVGSVILSMQSNTGYANGATWRHLLASWDLATGVAQLYFSDVSDLAATPTLTNDTLDYTTDDETIGGEVIGGNVNRAWNGCLADFYFAPGQYLDFSNVFFRRKFISSIGKPVHLGVTGALPTGTAPLVYHHIDDGEAVANFATNRGTGGNFTITGTLDTASTSPSG